ncbi:hypothetical protein AC578_6325 [Pseudocercospora eumusae]|uniref:Uncharacterized protein n=1 Tax=Pseudocercospora eumusae TaxID=321146 RepID=A0A139H1Z5_9PEZI|nr:hypothetical protein AC578_6325 [Pseudocercospora eumusae]
MSPAYGLAADTCGVALLVMTFVFKITDAECFASLKVMKDKTVRLKSQTRLTGRKTGMDGTIHFHEDDLDDAVWSTEMTICVLVLDFDFHLPTTSRLV